MNTLGISLSFAVKRWPEPEVWAEIVAKELELHLAQFTFDLVDPWWPTRWSSRLARRARQAAAANSITLHSAFMGLAAYTYNALLHPDAEGRAAAKAWYHRAIDLSSELGVSMMGGPIGGMSIREGHADQRYRSLLADLYELAEYARTQGLEALLIEPTPVRREVPWTIESAQKLIRDLEGTAVPFYYCLDIGHALYQPLYKEGANLRSWLEGLGDKVAMLHLQQTDGLSDSHWSFAGTKGVVNLNRVMIDLQETGLRHIPVIIEVFYPFELDDEAVFLDLKHGMGALKHVLQSTETS